MYEELLIDTYKKLTEIGKNIFEQIGKTYRISYELINNDTYKKEQYSYINAIDKERAEAELTEFYKEQDCIIKIISVEEMTYREGE
jgi:hypothetical protein